MDELARCGAVDLVGLCRIGQIHESPRTPLSRAVAVGFIGAILIVIITELFLFGICIAPFLQRCAKLSERIPSCRTQSHKERLWPV